MKKIIFLTVLALCYANGVFSQSQIVYKTIDSVQLFMEVYSPESAEKSKRYPGMVFFFGGAFKNGDKVQFINHAKYFAERGIVCFLVDYRISSKHGTTPIESLKDAKSAIRFVRKNAQEFGVDPGKIITSGGSAGGYLAMAPAFIERYNESTDDLSFSCVPNALVLFNPVINAGPDVVYFKKINDDYRNFSPVHNIKTAAPPTIVLLGTKDHVTPVESAKNLQKEIENVGGRCDLKLYEGAGHGFFNYRNHDYYKTTLLEADEFLKTLGYLN